MLCLFNHLVMSNSLRLHGQQNARLPILHYLPELAVFISIQSVMPSSHLILCCPFLLLPSVFPRIRAFSNESVLCIRWPKYWSLSFSINPSNEHSGLMSFNTDWFDLLAVQGTVKSSPTPLFKSINSSALSYLYGPTLTYIHDYKKSHSFGQLDLCWQSDVSAFQHASQVYHDFSSKQQEYFNFVAIVTTNSDFGVQQNEIIHCFHFFLNYFAMK